MHPHRREFVTRSNWLTFALALDQAYRALQKERLAAVRHRARPVALCAAEIVAFTVPHATLRAAVLAQAIVLVVAANARSVAVAAFGAAAALRVRLRRSCRSFEVVVAAGGFAALPAACLVNVEQYVTMPARTTRSDIRRWEADMRALGRRWQTYLGEPLTVQQLQTAVVLLERFDGTVAELLHVVRRL